MRPTTAKKTAKVKKPTTRLSKPLKANYDHWLDWEYYGEKLTYQRWNAATAAHETVTGPLPVNNKRSLNFWREKGVLTGSHKQETVYDLLRLYRDREIEYEKLLFFVNKISQKKITAHNRNEATYYYCNSAFGKVANLMLDWDDKKREYGDTHEAAHWLDHEHLLGQGYIQSSTSGTGTHQYVFVLVDGVSVPDQKRLYAELIPLLRLEVKRAGFACWKSFDEVKGVAPVISWHKATSLEYADNPYYPQIKVCGLLAKFPRLSTPEDEAVWLNRKIINWDCLVGLVQKLKAIHGPTDKGGRDRTVGGTVTGTVTFADLEDDDLPEPVQREVVKGKLKDMLGGENKQRAALACVFVFEHEQGRRPSDTDFDVLNAVYNRSATATGTTLTADRVKMFRKAISYSEGRGATSKQLIAPAALQTASAAFQGYDLTTINRKLVKAQQKPLTAEALARVWNYWLHNYNSQKGTAWAGRVPFESLKGLADCDTRFDDEKFPKLSRNAITESMKVFAGMGLIKVVKQHDRMGHRCATYELVKLPDVPPVDPLA